MARSVAGKGATPGIAGLLSNELLDDPHLGESGTSQYGLVALARGLMRERETARRTQAFDAPNAVVAGGPARGGRAYARRWSPGRRVQMTTARSLASATQATQAISTAWRGSRIQSISGV